MCTAGNKYRPSKPECCGSCSNHELEIWRLKSTHKEDQKEIEELKSILDHLKQKHRRLVNAVIDFITEHTTDMSLGVDEAIADRADPINSLMEELDMILTKIEGERDAT